MAALLLSLVVEARRREHAADPRRLRPSSDRSHGQPGPSAVCIPLLVAALLVAMAPVMRRRVADAVGIATAAVLCAVLLCGAMGLGLAMMWGS